jgi:hypothetical protein
MLRRPPLRNATTYLRSRPHAFSRTVSPSPICIFVAERLTAVQLHDAHFAAQLVERLRWAAEEAEHAEREAVIREPQIAPPR